LIFIPVVGVDSPPDITAVPQIIQVRHRLTCRHLYLSVADFAAKETLEALRQQLGLHQQVIQICKRQPMAVDDLVESDTNAREGRLVSG